MTSLEQARLLIRCDAQVGEGPIYDSNSRTLYWVDIPAGRLWRWHEPTGDVRHRDIGSPLGCVALIEGGGLLLAAGATLLALADWSSPLSLWRSLPSPTTERFNDGKCDSRGRFFVGTVTNSKAESGALYRVDHDGIHRLVTGVQMSNGLDWSPDDIWFYHVDTLSRTVVRYRWDADAGVPHDPEPFLTLPSGEGLPDGLSVDAKGHLWLAVWGSSQVRRYDPRGRLVEAIRVPTPHVSSCRFAGPLSNRLYVTTAADDASPRTRGHGYGGSVYVVDSATFGQSHRGFAREAISPSLLSTAEPG